MQSHYDVLVVGGGNAGLSAAAQLLRKKPGLKVGIIEPLDKHYYQPAWTLVGGGTFKLEDTVKDEKDFIPKGAHWIKDKVKSFDPETNKVYTEKGESYNYRYLIVVPGIQLDWDKIKGLKESLGKNGVCSNYSYWTANYTWTCLKTFSGGKAIFTNPNTPIKCGGAPQKIMYLAADHFRKENILKNSNIEFHSGGGIIFGVKKYADTLNKVINKYGIKTYFKENLVEIRGDEKIAVFETTDAEGETSTKEVAYDFIHVTPPQSAPDFIKTSSLAVPGNPLGWVDVDQYTLQHKRYQNIFSAGDACSTPNAKTGAAVRKQIPVLISNLISSLEGKPLTAKYTGYGSCPLITGYGKLVLAEFDYENKPKETFPFDQSKERYSMWLLKKFVLPWMYWNKILRGTA